jgi:predicted Co/Zn/Cd cation transporter (cation efflux family)
MMNVETTEPGQDTIERQALRVGAVGNLVMAFAAWFTYYASNSEAILLDGNYSFIIFVGMLVALGIARVRARRTATFPLGQFFYESLYGFIKGLMMIGVITMAVVTSVVRIVFYIVGSTANIPMLNPDPILYYALAMAVICFALSLFYRDRNARIGNRSIILATDTRAAFVDGTLSLGIAVGVFFLRNTDPAGGAGFVPYLADSIITLVLSAMLIGKPIAIVRDAVVELAGGTVQNLSDRETIQNAVLEAVRTPFVHDSSYISKTGSRYMVVSTVTVDDEQSAAVPVAEVERMRRRLIESLEMSYPHLIVEFILRPSAPGA